VGAPPRTAVFYASLPPPSPNPTEMSQHLQLFVTSTWRRTLRLFSGRNEPHVERQRPLSDIRFPIEVWEVIITILSETKASLFHLLTISSRLYPEVERVIYRHINLTGDTELHFKRRMRLFKQLATHAYIGQSVETLTIARIKQDSKSTPRYTSA
jgi:hypothetical protein